MYLLSADWIFRSDTDLVKVSAGVLQFYGPIRPRSIICLWGIKGGAQVHVLCPFAHKKVLN